MSGVHVGGDDRLRKLVVAVLPFKYVGPVYVHLQPPVEEMNVDVKFSWGPWTYERTLTVKEGGVALVFAKTQEDNDQNRRQPPLRVATKQPLGINVYIGSPDLPSDQVLDCNKGWTGG